jgi:hypothetical protein
MASRHPYAKIGIEAAANGHAIYDQLKRKIPSVYEIKTNGDSKAARAASVQAIVASGVVVLPQHAPWVDAFVDEVSAFAPGGRGHDDQVDAMVYALRELQAPTRVTWAQATRSQLARQAERVEAQRTLELHPERCIRCASIGDMQLVELLGDPANLAGTMRASTCRRCCDLTEAAAGWRPARRKRYVPVKPRDRDRGRVDESPTQRGFAFLPRQK